jgi:hypothetical protein
LGQASSRALPGSRSASSTGSHAERCRRSAVALGAGGVKTQPPAYLRQEKGQQDVT